MDARALGVRDIHFIETSIADPGVSQTRKVVRAGATHVIAAGGEQFALLRQVGSHRSAHGYPSRGHWQRFGP